MTDRILKFRAWDKKRNKMCIVMSLTRPEQTPIIIVRNMLESVSEGILSSDLEIMQFTGLLDKNGKEIYEGDIIKLEESYGVVSWIDTWACFKIISSETTSDMGQGNIQVDYPMSRYICCKQEVIGNVYETPELLEG